MYSFAYKLILFNCYLWMRLIETKVSGVSSENGYKLQLRLGLKFEQETAVCNENIAEIFYLNFQFKWQKSSNRSKKSQNFFIYQLMILHISAMFYLHFEISDTFLLH